MPLFYQYCIFVNVKYPDHIKLQAFKLFKNETKINTIINQLKISRSALYNWLKLNHVIFNDKKTKHITYQEFLKTKTERDLAIRNLQIYQELHCFPDATTHEKEIAIKRLVGKYPIHAMCKLLNLPKGTFYNFYLRRKVITQTQIRDETIKQKIMEIYLQSNKRFGAKKILIKLREAQINTTLHKVQTLMKLLNIQSTQQIHKQEISILDHSQYYINKLKRVFKQNAPNQYWVSNITELRINKNKFFLCVILDLFSRKVIAYRLSSQNNTNLTINTFKDAYENRYRPTGLSFHSDQGANYTAFEFRDLLRSLKVNQSFLKPLTHTITLVWKRFLLRLNAKNIMLKITNILKN